MTQRSKLRERSFSSSLRTAAHDEPKAPSTGNSVNVYCSVAAIRNTVETDLSLHQTATGTASKCIPSSGPKVDSTQNGSCAAQINIQDMNPPSCTKSLQPFACILQTRPSNAISASNSPSSDVSSWSQGGNSSETKIRLTKSRRKTAGAGDLPMRWTRDEDEYLRSAVASQGQDWKAISLSFCGTRSEMHCQQRWLKVLQPGLVKGPWTLEEDEIIRRCLKEGMTRWADIAEFVPGRVGKQCRERWHNNLDPELSREPWTEEDDQILIDRQKDWGNAWVKIAKELPGRSENAVKNRWYSAGRKLSKMKAPSDSKSLLNTRRIDFGNTRKHGHMQGKDSDTQQELVSVQGQEKQTPFNLTAQDKKPPLRTQAATLLLAKQAAKALRDKSPGNFASTRAKKSLFREPSDECLFVQQVEGPMILKQAEEPLLFVQVEEQLLGKQRKIFAVARQDLESHVFRQTNRPGLVKPAQEPLAAKQPKDPVFLNQSKAFLTCEQAGESFYIKEYQEFLLNEQSREPLIAKQRKRPLDFGNTKEPPPANPKTAKEMNPMVVPSGQEARNVRQSRNCSFLRQYREALAIEEAKEPEEVKRARWRRQQREALARSSLMDKVKHTEVVEWPAYPFPPLPFARETATPTLDGQNKILDISKLESLLTALESAQPMPSSNSPGPQAFLAFSPTTARSSFVMTSPTSFHSPLPSNHPELGSPFPEIPWKFNSATLAQDIPIYVPMDGHSTIPAWPRTFP